MRRFSTLCWHSTSLALAVHLPSCLGTFTCHVNKHFQTLANIYMSFKQTFSNSSQHSIKKHLQTLANIYMPFKQTENSSLASQALSVLLHQFRCHAFLAVHPLHRKVFWCFILYFYSLDFLYLLYIIFLYFCNFTFSYFLYLLFLQYCCHTFLVVHPLHRKVCNLHQLNCSIFVFLFCISTF